MYDADDGSKALIELNELIIRTTRDCGNRTDIGPRPFHRGHMSLSFFLFSAAC